MKRLWRAAGITSFWVSWPLLFMYLRNSHRTRVFIVYGDEMLAVKNWLGTGKWMLPGGGVMRSESSKAAAVREVDEELGITITESQLSKLTATQYKQNGFRFQYECYAIVLPKKLPVRLQKSEIADYAWLKLDRLTKSRCSSDIMTAAAAWSKSAKLLK